MLIHRLCVMTTEASMRSHVSLLILRLEWPWPRQISFLRNVVGIHRALFVWDAKTIDESVITTTPETAVRKHSLVGSSQCKTTFVGTNIL